MTEKEKQLRSNIEVVFSYARTYIANTKPAAENEMLVMINLKAEILEQLNLIQNKEESILEPEPVTEPKKKVPEKV